MKPLGLSAYRVAKAIDVPPNRIQDIAREERNITPATALRLAKLFGNSAEFWMKLGDIRFAGDKDTQALEAYRRASELSIGSVTTTNPEALAAVARVEEVLALDPSRRNLSAGERAARWNRILERILVSEEACLTPEARASAEALVKRRVRDLAALDQKAGAARELWQTMTPEWRTDPVLAHIFHQLAQ